MLFTHVYVVVHLRFVFSAFFSFEGSFFLVLVHFSCQRSLIKLNLNVAVFCLPSRQFLTLKFVGGECCCVCDVAVFPPNSINLIN